MLGAAGRYVWQHPQEIRRAVRNAANLRIGVPLVAFRYLVSELVPKDSDSDVVIEAAPPGLRLAGTVNAMETKLRASAIICIDDVEIDANTMRLTVRLEDIDVQVLSDKKTQLSALLKSGALSVREPGALINELPDMPPVIVSAVGNRVTLDLLKAPQLGENEMARKALRVLSSIVTVSRIETADEHFEVKFRAFPGGVMDAAEAVSDNVVEPGLRLARDLLAGQPASRGESGPLRRMLSLMGN